MASTGSTEAERTASAHLSGAIARGDERAFATFYELWFDRAFALARTMTRRDESFCLDVVQDAMLRVVRRMPPLASEAAVDAWMGRTVLTTALDRLRAERRRARRECWAALPEAIAPAADAELDGAERRAWLHARIDELPAGERRLLAERFDADRTLAEVGASLGMSLHAAHGRIRRALARLRRAAREVFGD